MSDFKELLEESGTTSAFDDEEWVNAVLLNLLTMPDVYLVESLRLNLMVCAWRLAGTGVEDRSAELTFHGLKEVTEIIYKQVVMKDD